METDPMETDDVSKLAASSSWRATAMVGENVVDTFHYVNYRVSTLIHANGMTPVVISFWLKNHFGQSLLCTPSE